MTTEAARLTVTAVIEEMLTDDAAYKLMRDDAFVERHCNGLIAAVSAAGTADAEESCAQEYAETLREELREKYAGDLRPED